MYRTVIGAALLTLGFLVLPGKAADEKKPTEKKPADAKKDIDKKDSGLVSAGRILGTIESVEESKRSLRIKMGQKTLNPVAMDSYKQALKAFSKARTQQEKIGAAQQVANAKKDLYVDVLELQTTDDVVVRVAQPPSQFDEKGRVKKYTFKELRELKGDKKLPGYAGEFSNLRQKQIVQISLVKKREIRQPRGVRAKDTDTDLVADNLPMVNMVIVLRDPGN